jgi:hypothetical protein
MRRLFLLAAAFWVVACGEDNQPNESPTGTLQITTATTGQPGTELTVIVDGASPRTVNPNGTLSIETIAVGDHIVQLTLPTGCTVAGENPRTVSVTAANTTTVDFAVTCS